MTENGSAGASKLPRPSEPLDVEVYLMKMDYKLFVSSSPPVFETLYFRVLGQWNKPRTRYRPDAAIALFDPDERSIPALGTREKKRLGVAISQAVSEKNGCACVNLRADQIDLSGGIFQW